MARKIPEVEEGEEGAVVAGVAPEGIVDGDAGLVIDGLAQGLADEDEIEARVDVLVVQ